MYFQEMPGAPAILRFAQPGDARAVARVQVETWRAAYRGIVSDQFLDAFSIEDRAIRWDELLRQPEQHLLVAETTGQGVIGFAGFGPERTGHPEFTGELYSLYVLPAFQGTGLGRQFVSAVAKWLLDHQYPTMLVWTLADNPSRGFYEHLGGQRVVQQQIEIGGRLLDEVAYGWSELKSLSNNASRSRNFALRTSMLHYDADDHWAQVPDGWTWEEVTATAVDSRDRVFVFNRGEHPVMIFNRDGSFVAAWGEGQFARPHGITIGPDDSVYCTDDLDHTVRKFTPDGELLLTLGTSGKPADTGATSIDYRSIRRAGPPFYFPTNVALGANGDIFVSDGYGNARVHRFSADGNLLRSWGEPGGGPGQFHVPHGIAVAPDSSVFVADRENCRIQIFSPDGEFLTERTDIARPCQVAFDAEGRLFVAELGYKSGMWPGTTAPTPDATGGRVSVFDPGGNLLARWGGGMNPTAPGDFYAPHDISIDSHGDLYVSEVVWSAGAKRGLVDPTCHSLQKFVARG
ncbi:MAG: GNAT family N-acetyltransferase [Planctomycetaceae bacterium]|nr:GNAT family N-acetyltransferase [Planctomycetaceae bacterium]